VNKKQIARDVGLCYSAVCKIIDRYEQGDMAALAPQTRGRHVGDKHVLTVEQEQAMRSLICDKRPNS
jgi:hypothetical protein